MPDPAEVRPLLGKLGDLDDLRVLGESRDERIVRERAEAAPERDELRGRELLVAKEHDQMVDQRTADTRYGVVGQRLRQVGAVYLRAQRAGDGHDIERILLARVQGGVAETLLGNCSTSTSRPSAPATIEKSRSSALTNAVAKRGNREPHALIAPSQTR